MRTSVLTRPTFILPSLSLLLGLGWCLGVGPRLKAGPPAAHAAAAMPDETVRRMEAARRDFRQYCARCHDNDLTGRGWRQRGRRIPDFTNGPWHVSRTDDQLFVSILEGKGVSMPGFSDTLSEEQSRGLLLLIRQVNPMRSGMSGTAPPEFTNRYIELTEQLEILRRQYRELANTPRKPAIRGH